MTLADDLTASLAFAQGRGTSVQISQDMAQEVIVQLRRLEPTPGATRLIVNMNDATRDAIVDLTRDGEFSYTEVIRRAVSVAYFIDKEVRDGWSLYLKNVEGFHKEVLIP